MAREKGDRAGDVLGRAETRERDLPDHAGLDRVGEHVGHVRGDETRRDRVAGDPAARHFARDRFGQPDQPRLARRIVRLPGVAHQPRHAGDVDDVSAALLEHRADHCLDEIECALEIGIQHHIPVLLAHPHEEPVAGQPRIVDQNIHPRKVREDLLREFLHGCGLRHIHRVGLGQAGILCVDLLGGLEGILFRAADHRDARALAGEAEGDGVSDAAAGSGDDGDLIGESHEPASLRKRGRRCPASSVSVRAIPSGLRDPQLETRWSFDPANVKRKRL